MEMKEPQGAPNTALEAHLKEFKQLKKAEIDQILQKLIKKKDTNLILFEVPKTVNLA